MWNILTRKSSSGIRSKRRGHGGGLDQRGQAVMEYLIIIFVVVGIFVAFARPMIGKIGTNVRKALDAGFFKDDPSGSGFYYYPMK